jgi:hypothetical protein
MKSHLLLTAAILATGLSMEALAQSPQEHEQHHPNAPAAQTQPGQVPPPATAPSGQMPMGQMMQHMHDMMRGGMMGRGGMHSGMMMRMLFAMMDSDGDGTISLQEFQAAHERIFKAMDANKDGVLTLEEIQVFMHGTKAQVPPGTGQPTRRSHD